MKDFQVCDNLIKIIENGSFKKIVIKASELYAYTKNYNEYVDKCRMQEKTIEGYHYHIGCERTDNFEFEEIYILNNKDDEEWKNTVIEKLKFYIENRIFSIEYYLLDSNDNIMDEDRSYTLEEAFDTFIFYSLY